MKTTLPQNAVFLLVEDRLDDITLAKRAFRQLKLNNPLHIVTSGEDAFAYLTGYGKYADRDTFPLPDIILLDLKLPGMDGFELLAEIRKRPELNPVRILVLTSSEQIYDINRAYSLGANSFLVKPNDFQDFRQLMVTLNAFWLQTNKMTSVAPTVAPANPAHSTV